MINVKENQQEESSSTTTTTKDDFDNETNGDDSDAGSDIFMPGGITMKAAEIGENSSNDPDSKDPEDAVENDAKPEVEAEVEDKQVTNVTKRSISKSVSMESDDDDDDSHSGSLEINTEGTPDIENEKPTSKHKDQEHFEDRNIFNNTDLFPEKENTLQSEENESSRTNEMKEEEINSDPTPPYYEYVDTNLYLVDKKKSRSNKQVRRMTCECLFEPDDPLFVGCDDDCLNRLLMIECSKTCPTGEFCTNRNFQKGCKYDLEVTKAGRKGWGLRTKEPIAKGSFIIEYSGEVVDYDEFHKRTLQYEAEKMSHYYFMTLKTNEIIDATKKGCKSRFINHSCDPNCQTEKWTVNGFLRVGFFAVRDIEAFDELCFDYQFQRFGEKPQECYCGAENCRGVIGIEQTNSLPSYIEKIMSNSPSMSSSKQKKRKKQMKEFYESELASELNKLLGPKWELHESKQALELLRLMVKIETLHERKELLKILQTTNDAVPLKAFVRYKGLALLWSWMVDAPDDKPKYKVEILKTLKHIPIPNKNELDDSKLTSIIMKWATPLPEPTGDNISSSRKHDSVTDDDSPSDNETKNDEGNTSQDDSSKDDDDSENGKKLTSMSSVEEGDKDEVSAEKNCRKTKKKDKATRKKERKESRKRDIPSLSAALLEEWKNLKEVFRIPKKSQTPDRRSKVETEETCTSIDDKRAVVKSNTESPSQQFTEVDSSCGSTKTMVADSTFCSPPAKQKPSISKGPVTPLLNNVDEENDIGEKSSDAIEASNSKRHGRREWRKSPAGGDERYKRFDKKSSSTEQMKADTTNPTKDDGPADSTWNVCDDSWDHRRDSRWTPRNRDRRRNFDDRRNWNDYDGNNDGDRHRNWNSNTNWRGRNKPWMDRNNRGGRMNRDHGNNSDDSGDNTSLHWRKGNPRPWVHQPNFAGVNMNVPLRPNIPSLIGGNMPNQRPPIFPGNMMPQPNLMPSGVPPRMFHPPPIPTINPLVTNQMQQNSPLVSPIAPQQPFNQIPVPPATKPVNTGQFNSPVQHDVTALNVVNQLQLLLNAERLKQAQDGSRQGTPDQNRSSSSISPRRTSSSSPTRSKPLPSLPAHWKTATDAEGRMYYYHAITRQTSWDPPIAFEEDDMEVSPPKKTRKSHLGDPPQSPPHTRQSPPHTRQSPPHTRHSPRIVAADTTHHHGPRTPPNPKSSRNHMSSSEKQRIKEAFKSKMSSVVVNCLNAYQKVDCKQGRIKNTDDFKFLARKLTHGLIMKEIQRIKNEELLNCNDNVKMKVKEYIRNYMKKFGPYYVRS